MLGANGSRNMRRILSWPTVLLVLAATPLAGTFPLEDVAGPRLVIAIYGGSADGYSFRDSIGNYQPSIRHDAPVNQFEVNLRAGQFVLRQTDFFAPGPMPIAVIRTWQAFNNVPHAFGVGMNHPYDICPTGGSQESLYSAWNMLLEDDVKVHFRRTSPGAGFANGVFVHDDSSSDFWNAQAYWNGNGWTLRFRDLTKVFFPDSYHGTTSWWGAPTEIMDALGNAIRLVRSPARTLTRIVGPSGHSVSFQYDNEKRIIAASDDSGNSRKYRYDSTGHLVAVADAWRTLYRFTFEPLQDDEQFDRYFMTHVMGADGRDLVQVAYWQRRVASVKLRDGSTWLFDYDWSSSDKLLRTIVTFPDGHTAHFNF
jgi:YD repeat-containing protein